MKHLHTMLITVVPEIALHAQDSGVDTLFIDMETRGKAERQGHLDTHKSAHTYADVARIAAVLTRAELLVRINPPWEGTSAEVDAAIDAGAQRLMLPMFRNVAEVVDFKRAVAGRVPVTLLVETAASLARLPLILPLLEADDRIHFGLNDLCIDMRLDFLFEVLGGRLLDGPAAFCREAGVPFGIGGVGCLGNGMVPAEWVLSEHVRLGSEWVILSRAFHGGADTLAALLARLDLAVELAALQRCYQELALTGPNVLEANQASLALRAAAINVQQQQQKVA
ncbi:aldolase/citrate lyase family protein [Billgrantia sp. Q4P2]|uniref:aldolase/citrate lyase family protein n=1 Tax=Billgrantia sp. Q4P2 TaxID=3463857 RepID=UPI004056B26C